MIKVHDRLWYVINPEREDNLSYMTYYEDNKAFEKRKSTGQGWAGGRQYCYETGEYITHNPNVEGEIVDNSPRNGFYIGSSVVRWSTSNKLFRVRDSRGFTVEVPTDNIATILHLTTVVNGVIQEECVWGREGSNHILLPVNSEPYLKGVKNTKLSKSTKIKVSELKPGAKVKLFNDDNVYKFLGRGKITHLIKPYQNKHKGWVWEKVPLKEYEYTAKTYTNIFSYEVEYLAATTCEKTISSPKIIEIVEQGDGKEYDGALEVRAPYSSCDYSFESEVVSVKWKK